MTIHIRLTLALLLLIFLTAGCTALRQTPEAEVAAESAEEKAVSEEADETPADKDSKPYYYFVEAQLERNHGELKKSAEYLQKAIELDPESTYLKMELAAVLMTDKSYEQSSKVLQELIEKNPQDADALTLYARVQQALKKPESARDAFKRVIEIDPERENVYLALGAILLKEKDFDGAFDIYTALLEQFPRSYRGHYFLGKIQAEQDRPQEAEASFKRTLELAPDLEEPRIELLKLYEKENQSDKAEALYLEILGREPDHIGAFMGLGLLYHRQGNVSQSEEILFELGRRLADEPQIVSQIVQVYMEPKRFEDAIVITEGMISGAPHNSALHYLAGLAYDGVKNEEMVIHHFLQVKPETRFYENAAVHVAFVYHERGETDQAIALMEEAIAQLPDKAVLYLYMGTFYEDLKDYEKAYNVLQQGLEREAENVRLLFRLGVVADKLGNKDETIETMKEIIRLDPKHANALNYLGYTYAELDRDLDVAEDLIRRALEIKPEDGYITDSLGWVFYKKGQYNEALEVLLRAITFVNDDPVILEHVGDTYLKLGNKEKALEYYNKSMQHKEEDRDKLQEKIDALTGQD